MFRAGREGVGREVDQWLAGSLRQYNHDHRVKK